MTLTHLFIFSISTSWTSWSSGEVIEKWWKPCSLSSRSVIINQRHSRQPLPRTRNEKESACGLRILYQDTLLDIVHWRKNKRGVRISVLDSITGVMTGGFPTLSTNTKVSTTTCFAFRVKETRHTCVYSMDALNCDLRFKFCKLEGSFRLNKDIPICLPAFSSTSLRLYNTQLHSGSSIMSSPTPTRKECRESPCIS